MIQPYWDDIASALEEVIQDDGPINMPGLKAMIAQAIVELRALKQQSETKANPAVLEALTRYNPPYEDWAAHMEQVETQLRCSHPRGVVVSFDPYRELCYECNKVIERPALDKALRAV